MSCLHKAALPVNPVRSPAPATYSPILHATYSHFLWVFTFLVLCYLASQFHRLIELALTSEGRGPQLGIGLRDQELEMLFWPSVVAIFRVVLFFKYRWMDIQAQTWHP